MKYKKWLSMALAVCLTACAVGTRTIKFEGTEAVTREAYTQSASDNGVVLLDINWGRWWGCGGHENAQLTGLAFDKLPPNPSDTDAAPSLVIHSPSRVMVDPVFLNHAFLVEPGEYGLSAFSIKVADSITEVSFLTAQRGHLYEDGKPVGGTFTVKPGEAVYIGNFYLDCTYGPTLWRYYTEGRENFSKQVAEYKESFPFLDLDNVRYRLFKTEKFGHDYELPP